MEKKRGKLSGSCGGAEQDKKKHETDGGKKARQSKVDESGNRYKIETQ